MPRPPCICHKNKAGFGGRGLRFFQIMNIFVRPRLIRGSESVTGQSTFK